MKERFDSIKHRYDGHAVQFCVDVVKLPNGKKADREYLHHAGAVAVVAHIDESKILMVRQYRYAVKSTTWEIPAGKIDPKESVVKCALRELEEETGYHAGRLVPLLTYWPTSAFSTEKLHIYEAFDLKKGKAHPDSDEFITAKPVSLRQATRWVWDGTIKDAKTMIALLALQSR